MELREEEREEGREERREVEERKGRRGKNLKVGVELLNPTFEPRVEELLRVANSNFPTRVGWLELGLPNSNSTQSCPTVGPELDFDS